MSYEDVLADAQAVQFELPHLTLKGLCGGDPQGPLLIMLHGWLDNCHSFVPMMPHLQNFRWIALDFPGHGHSQHRCEGAHYYFLDWVYDLQVLFKQQGWQDVLVLGHSMGGYVAQTLAIVAPELVKRLSLIEAFGMLYAPPEDSLQQLRDGMQSRFKQLQRKRPLYPKLDHLVQARMDAGDIGEDEARLLLQRNLRKVDGGYVWRTDPGVRTTSVIRYTLEQIDNLMQSLHTPTQLVLGQSGHSQLKQAQARWQGQVRTLTVGTLPGGHHLHMQNPQLVASAVTEHLLQTAAEAG